MFSVHVLDRNGILLRLCLYVYVHILVTQYTQPVDVPDGVPSE